MIDLLNVKKIYLYPGATDFRKGINGLSRLVGTEIETSCMYIFCNARLTDLKILLIEENAISVYHRRLFKNKYIYPRTGEATLITISDIKSVINSVDFVNKIEQKSIDKFDVF